MLMEMILNIMARSFVVLRPFMALEKQDFWTEKNILASGEKIGIMGKAHSNVQMGLNLMEILKIIK